SENALKEINGLWKHTGTLLDVKSRKRVCSGPASNCGQGIMTLLMCVWRLSEREAGHNIYPLWEDETPQSQLQSANNIHPPLLPFQYQKALSVSELYMENYYRHS
ncbi:hypothetical protein PO909_009877, partial [Leuciscus waleckii]